MNIHDLTSFQVIARENSLTKASKLLYMTPQGLSKIVKNLEQELNCQLLVRTKAGTSLTESGQCLAKYADRITSDYGELRNKKTSKSDMLLVRQTVKYQKFSADNACISI